MPVLCGIPTFWRISCCGVFRSLPYGFAVSTLYNRRKIVKLCIHSISHNYWDDLFSSLSSCTYEHSLYIPVGILTACNWLSLIAIYTNCFNFSFVIHASKLWNILPFNVAAINALSTLKYILTYMYAQYCVILSLSLLIIIHIVVVHVPCLVTRFILAFTIAIFLYGMCFCTNLLQ